jgi:outer membrane protein assembly factor BamB
MEKSKRSTQVLILAISLFLLQLFGYGQSPDFTQAPTTAWRFKVGAPVISSPVISDGVAFFGALDSTVYAIDVKSGTLKWKLKTNGEIRSTLVLSGDKLYLAGGNGVLSCIDKVAGKALWRVLFDNLALFIGERRYDFADYYHSTPLVLDNVVYLGSGSGRVQAFTADKGELIWTYNTGDIVHNVPAVVGDKLFVGSFDGNMYALNRQTGTLLWKFKTVGQQYFPDGEVQGSPATAYGSVYFGSRDYNLYALDIHGGHARWNRKFEGGWALSTTVKDSTVYVGTSDDRLFLAIDAITGHEKWKLDVKFNIFGNCAFTPSIVYVGTIWGKLYAVDRKAGTIKWAFATDGYNENHLKYFKADDSYREDIGSILKSPSQFVGAEFRMGGIFSTPAISGDMMVVTTAEGTVYGLRRK